MVFKAGNADDSGDVVGAVRPIAAWVKTMMVAEQGAGAGQEDGRGDAMPRVIRLEDMASRKHDTGPLTGCGSGNGRGYRCSRCVCVAEATGRRVRGRGRACVIQHSSGITPLL